VWGLLFGAAFFFIPGIGPVVLAGPLVASLVGALEGAVVVGGLTALGAVLASLGIPRNSIVQYETALKADKFLVIAHGTQEDVARAKDSAFHVMLFLENLIRALLIFNKLRSRHCQRALLGYHYQRGSLDYTWDGMLSKGMRNQVWSDGGSQSYD
jgi:hypothetical protein